MYVYLCLARSAALVYSWISRCARAMRRALLRAMRPPEVEEGVVATEQTTCATIINIIKILRENEKYGAKHLQKNQKVKLQTTF